MRLTLTLESSCVYSLIRDCGIRARHRRQSFHSETGGRLLSGLGERGQNGRHRRGGRGTCRWTWRDGEIAFDGLDVVVSALSLPQFPCQVDLMVGSKVATIGALRCALGVAA